LERTDSQEMLVQLEQANLFITPWIIPGPGTVITCYSRSC